MSETPKRCPKCGKSDTCIYFISNPPARWCCPRDLGGCGHVWPYLSPAVKSVFKACRRAMTLWRSAADCAGWVGGERRRRLADAGDETARRAIALAEGKGAKKPCS